MFYSEIPAQASFTLPTPTTINHKTSGAGDKWQIHSSFLFLNYFSSVWCFHFFISKSWTLSLVVFLIFKCLIVDFILWFNSGFHLGDVELFVVFECEIKYRTALKSWSFIDCIIATHVPMCKVCFWSSHLIIYCHLLIFTFDVNFMLIGV